MERQTSIITSSGSLDSHDHECMRVILQLKQQFGYFDGDLSYKDKYEAESKALAKGWVLQNAYDRKLTYSELLRNSLDAELRLG